MNNLPTSVIQFQDFVQDYQFFEHRLALRQIAAITSLLANFNKKQAELTELMRLETPEYNLFEVLRIRHYETKVHTPFLAHLLNPNASHHQGRLFFNLFFENVFQQKFSVDEIDNIGVFIERRYAAYGQIDIQIWFRERGVQKAIVIENKIYHYDGEKQLYRYYQYLSAGKKLKDENISLIYLTLNGRQPSAQSSGATPKGCIKAISYCKNIAQWLTSALEKIHHNSLHFTIKQYQKTIQSL